MSLELLWFFLLRAAGQGLSCGTASSTAPRVVPRHNVEWAAAASLAAPRLFAQRPLPLAVQARRQQFAAQRGKGQAARTHRRADPQAGLDLAGDRGLLAGERVALEPVKAGMKGV